jgi:hypothetical protein
MTKCFICGKNIKKNECKVAYAGLSIVGESDKKRYSQALAGTLAIPHHVAHEDCAESVWEVESEAMY